VAKLKSGGGGATGAVHCAAGGAAGEFTPVSSGDSMCLLHRWWGSGCFVLVIRAMLVQFPSDR
jgi:hypothetical protein